ncbi:hypothetical protein J6590_075224 [Homalodisca vitripennis]|nr:hypothetical protein J6590_075224 [Homalodisca vitripennis]
MNERGPTDGAKLSTTKSLMTFCRYYEKKEINVQRRRPRIMSKAITVVTTGTVKEQTRKRRFHSPEEPLPILRWTGCRVYYEKKEINVQRRRPRLMSKAITVVTTGTVKEQTRKRRFHSPEEPLPILRWTGCRSSKESLIFNDNPAIEKLSNVKDHILSRIWRSFISITVPINGTWDNKQLEYEGTDGGVQVEIFFNNNFSDFVCDSSACRDGMDSCEVDDAFNFPSLHFERNMNE